MYRYSLHHVSWYDFIFLLISGHGSGANRPRSKTFEEYEKDTDDIWNDGGEVKFDEAELEFVAEEGGGGVEEPGGRKKGTGGGARGRGKGKGMYVCTYASVIRK